MAFEIENTKSAKQGPSSADEMVLLGHLAASGTKPITRKITKRGPIPREARVAFGIGLAFLVVCLTLIFMHG